MCSPNNPSPTGYPRDTISTLGCLFPVYAKPPPTLHSEEGVPYSEVGTKELYCTSHGVAGKKVVAAGRVPRSSQRLSCHNYGQSHLLTLFPWTLGRGDTMPPGFRTHHFLWRADPGAPEARRRQSYEFNDRDGELNGFQSV